MNVNPVFNVLLTAAEKWPNRTAVYDEFGEQTFSALLQEAEKIKSQLLNAGIQKGMAVGIIAKNSRNFIAGIFAVVGTGAVAMPMSHQLKTHEINEILKEAELSAILDDTSSKDYAPVQAEHILLTHGQFRLSQLKKFRGQQIPFAAHVEDPAFMRFTSGTTGKSKGVLISHESALQRTAAANKVLQLDQTDTVLWVLPMAYHFVVSILLYVRYGTAIAIAQDFLPKNLVDLANLSNATLLYASPMHIRLLAAMEGSPQMPSIKRVISTSAGISAEICKTFERKYNIPVSQAYGIIEIGLPMINSFNNSDFPDAVGHVLPDFELRLFNENLEPVTDGGAGKLGIKGPGMFDAYLNPPLTRAQVTIDGFFLTADFATISDQGLVTILGREKSIINISGNKVFPEEVEGVIETYPGVKTARISAIPHPLMGQIIQAELIAESTDQINVESLIDYCRKKLSTYKVPQRVIFLNELPMTSTGKLLRY
jgi:acyl-CoA synthetase (AMP-forming)/AMP-acid ligase II